MCKGHEVSIIWVTYHSSGSDKLTKSYGRMQIRLYHAPCIELCLSKQWYSYLDIICKLYWTIAQPDLRTLRAFSVVVRWVPILIVLIENPACPMIKQEKKTVTCEWEQEDHPRSFLLQKKVTHFLFALGSACYFHVTWKLTHLANRCSKEYMKSPFTHLSSGLCYLPAEIKFLDISDK